MGAADQVEPFHVPPQRRASHPVLPDPVQGALRGCVGDEDVVDVLLHPLHRPLEEVPDLLLGELKGGSEGGPVRPPDARHRDLPEGDGASVDGHGLRFLEGLQNLRGIAVPGDREAGDLDPVEEPEGILAGPELGDVPADEDEIGVQGKEGVQLPVPAVEVCKKEDPGHGEVSAWGIDNLPAGSLQEPVSFPSRASRPRSRSADRLTGCGEVPARGVPGRGMKEWRRTRPERVTHRMRSRVASSSSGSSKGKPRMRSTTGVNPWSLQSSTARIPSTTVCPLPIFLRTLSLPDWIPKATRVLEQYRAMRSSAGSETNSGRTSFGKVPK